MDLHELEGLPNDFAALLESPPGIFLARNVLDPVLFLVREGGAYTARLGAVRMKRGLATRLMAPGANFNWVADEGAIHPLPRDVPQLVDATLGGANPDDLAFRQVLALLRNPPAELSIEADSSVWQSAGEQAAVEPDLVEVPGLSATLYPYQARGIAWMRDTLARTGGVILADEMGLGKTIQILGVFLLDPPDPPSLR